MQTNQEAMKELGDAAETAAELTTDERPGSFGIRVFVYGTLKMGHSNHKIIGRHMPNEAVFLGRCSIRGPYTLVNLGYYPGVIQNKGELTVKNEVWGEVYRINEEILTHLDILEGNGHFYTRDKVDTPFKKAWCYFVPPTYMPKNRTGGILPDGVWQPSADELSFIQLAKTK